MKVAVVAALVKVEAYLVVLDLQVAAVMMTQIPAHPPVLHHLVALVHLPKEEVRNQPRRLPNQTSKEKIIMIKSKVAAQRCGRHHHLLKVVSVRKKIKEKNRLCLPKRGSKILKL